MNIKDQANQSKRITFAGLIFLFFVALNFSNFSMHAHAGPMAGVRINNQANSTYFDTATGRTERLDSNLVSTPVARFVSFSFTQSQNLVSAPGANVRFQHSILNAGNAPESFNLLLQDIYSGTYSFTAVQLFADENNDGIADSTTAITQTPVLQPGQTYQFIALAQVPSSALNGQEDRFTLIVAPTLGGAPQQTNVDTVTITNNAVMVVSKGFSVAAGPSPNSDLVVTLNYSNIGNSAATNVVISDVIGAPNAVPAYDTSGMQYSPNSGSWQSLAVTDAAGGDVAGISFQATTVGTAPNAVTTITATIANVPAGNSGTIRFKVDVKSGLTPGVAKTTNAASVAYFDGVGLQTGATNNTTYYRVVADGPDLVLTKRNSGNFSVGVKGRYIMRVSNIGAGPSIGRVTVTDVLPTGMTIYRASLPNGGADGWSCSVVGDTVSCDTFALIPSGQEAANPLVLVVKPESSLSGLTVTNRAQVSGGGELPNSPATQNNEATDSVLVGASASIAGFAWFDLNHNNLRESNEPPGINMIVEVINSDGVTVARVLTGNEGEYLVPNLAPGVGYKIVFRYPDGSTPVASTPINGEIGRPNPTSNGVVSKGTITGLTLTPGLSVVRQNLRLDPSGVIYDSVTRLPVAGAIVRLEGPAGFNPVEHLVGGLGNVEQTTGLAGIYQYILLEGAPVGAYRLVVTSPAAYTPGTSKALVPAASLNCGVTACLDPTGLAPRGGVFSVQPANIYTAPALGQDTTYYLAFNLDVATDPEIVNNHIPLDPIAAQRPGLLVEKSVNRGTAEIGDAVQFTIRVRNTTQSAFSQVQITDNFPLGFKYVAGSARLEGKALPDPINDGNASFRFVGLGDLAADSNRVLTYVAILSPGAQLGDGTNRAFARSGSSTSNIAVAKVTVTGGVFTTRGIVLGKLYVDCNRNHVQDAEELGIPGVRFYLQDGTYIVTDSEGKFSFAGLSPRTHVLKIDRTTLPKDAKLTSIANRNALDGQSRFIDLKNGELHRADFAEFSCSPSVVAEVKARRAKGEVFSIEVDKALLTKLDASGKLIAPTDVKALPASGLLGTGTFALTTALPSLSILPTLSTLPVAPATPISPVVPQPSVPAASPENLNDRLAQSDNSLAILDLQDGDTLPIAQTNFRIKGVLGALLKLTVNGQEISNARVGVKTEIAEKQLQYREYIGVPLKAGRNEIELLQQDDFGNSRGSQRLVLIAPDQPGRIEIDLPATGSATADGVTPVKIVVRITDSKGVPVTARTPVTLEASVGRWRVVDANPNEPGVQAFVKGGVAEFELMPPLEPIDAIVRVSSGILKTDKRLPFLPELRPLIGAGVLEGVLNLRNLRSGAVQPARARDGFEQELKHFSRQNSDGKTMAAARAAFFLKGKVKGEYLLTMAYDSDKDVRDRLFRDIRPDEFYPVYGDSSIKGFDAQSTSRLYVRVDKQKSYLLWGDFSTINFNPAQRLAQYQRALTGVRHHYENKGVTIDSFASRDTLRQVVREVAANGTSGPFELNLVNVLTNSERVELITRDRNQPALILRTTVLNRFIDYAFEPLSGRLLLRAPLASVDQLLNPNSIRVSVEIDQGGTPFWIYGSSASVKVTNALTLGANFVRNLNPIPETFTRMAGANVMYQFGERSILTAELANIVKADGKSGSAERIEFNHDGDQVKIRAAVGKSAAGFDNPASILRPGREEASVRAAYILQPGKVVAAEVLHTKDVLTGASRQGVLLNFEKSLGDTAKIEVGVRHVTENVPKSAQSVAVPLNGVPAQTDITSVRVKASSQVPTVPTASVYGEVEQDVNDTSKRLVALGGEYLFAGRGKLYARHEFQSSLQGAFALNNVQRTNVTVLGVSSEYMTNGTLFSEYRGRDSFGVRTTEAAVGLRNIFAVADGLRLNTNVERIRALSGSKDQQSEAIGVGLEYTGSELWKGSTRVEFRDATTSRSYLHTADAALKVSRDWTMLGRHIWNGIENKTSGTSAASERILQRLRVGVAFRDTDTNRLDALAMIEKKRETDTAVAAVISSRNVWVGSAHFNYQPRRAVVVNGQVATKHAEENFSGVATTSNTSLVAARVTYDFSERWDVGATVSTLINHQTKVAQKGMGFEVGYLLTSNTWLSAGYNLFGYRDRDLAPNSHSDKGAFIRLRFKFDEDTIKRRNDQPNDLKP